MRNLAAPALPSSASGGSDTESAAGGRHLGAVALTTILGNATLLTWNGDNHTAMAYSKCVADTAARYLIDLAVPPDGTRCPP